MSKRFKSQDHFRYKKLGKRWRKPVGLQSKLRLKKGGSGLRPSMGYGTPHKKQPVLIFTERDFEKDCAAGAILSSNVGSRKAVVLAAKAKELGITILNMKKVKRAKRLAKEITENKGEKKKKEAEKKAAEAKAKEKAAEKKTGAKKEEKPAAGKEDKPSPVHDHAHESHDHSHEGEGK